MIYNSFLRRSGSITATKGHLHLSHFVTQWLSRVWVIRNTKQQSAEKPCQQESCVLLLKLCRLPDAVAAGTQSLQLMYLLLLCFVSLQFAPVGQKGELLGDLGCWKQSTRLWRHEEVSVRAPPACSAACHQRLDRQLSISGSLENSPAIDLSGTGKNSFRINSNFTSYCALREICRLVKMQPLLLCSVDAGSSVQGNEDMTAPVCLGMHACMPCSTQLLHACMCACTLLWNSKLTQNLFFPSSFFQNRSSALHLCLSSAMLTPASQQSRHISVRDNLQLERTGSREGGKNQLWLLHSWLLPFGPLQQKSLTFVGCVYKAGTWCWRGQYTEEVEVLDQQLSQQLGCCFEEKQNHTWMDVRTNSGWNPPCSSLPELCI